MLIWNPIANHPEFGKAGACDAVALNLSPSDFVTPLTKQNVGDQFGQDAMGCLHRRGDAAQDIRQGPGERGEQLLVLKQQSTSRASQTYFWVVLAAQVQTKQEIEQGLAHHLIMPKSSKPRVR